MSSSAQSTTGAIIASGTSNEGVYHDDWNIKVLVEDQTFHVHKYVVENFEGLKDQIAQLESQGQHLIRLPGNPVDFENTFRLLYSTFYKPQEYGIGVLVSALRLATRFDHQELRTFVMRSIRLELLPREELVELIREIDSSDWRDKALTYLSSHSSQIELEEAEKLGMALLVEIISRRERKLSLGTLSPSRPITIYTPRTSSSQSRRQKSATRARNNRGEAWASFLDRTQEREREICGTEEQEESPYGNSTIRGLALGRVQKGETLPIGKILNNGPRGRQKRPRILKQS